MIFHVFQSIHKFLLVALPGRKTHLPDTDLNFAKIIICFIKSYTNIIKEHIKQYIQIVLHLISIMTLSYNAYNSIEKNTLLYAIKLQVSCTIFLTKVMLICMVFETLSLYLYNFVYGKISTTKLLKNAIRLRYVQFSSNKKVNFFSLLGKYYVQFRFPSNSGFGQNSFFWI